MPLLFHAMNVRQRLHITSKPTAAVSNRRKSYPVKLSTMYCIYAVFFIKVLAAMWTETAS